MNSRNSRGNPSSESSQKRALSKSFFTLAALSFSVIIGLGFFRFNASQLEFRLSGIERSIARHAAEEIELRQTLSSLISPVKIYSYCKDRLGMQAAEQETVRLPHIFVADTSFPEPQKGWRSSMFAFFGFSVF